MLNYKTKKPRFIFTLIIAAVAGALFAIIKFFHFLPFKLSTISFYGWIAAVTTLFFSFSAINYFLPQGFDLIRKLSWYFSGGLAGFIWWIVIKPPSIQMWMAIVAGIIITVFWWFVESVAAKRKSSAS